MRTDAIWANQAAARLWISQLAEDRVDADPSFLKPILQMLQAEPRERPTAAQVRARKKGVYKEDDLKLPDVESTDSVSASTLNLPGREEKAKPLTIEDTPDTQKPPATELTAQNTIVHPLATKSPVRKVRFAGLPEELRPMPTDPAQPSPDESATFVCPKHVVPPPFRQQDSLPLPGATLVPSYILAGTNHFTKTELSVSNRARHMESNLFVYSRLMFPSILNAIAVASTKGVYYPELRRRLHPTTADWAKADLSIKHASEAMTPAILRGYDRRRPRGLNCAVIKDGRLTKKILRRREDRGYKDLPCVPSGEVVGFLILGVRSESLRFCDAIFGGDEQTLRSMKTPDEDDDSDFESSDEESREDMIRLLLDNGAQVTGVSDGGQYGTPLIAAAYSGRKTISKLLIQCGADIYEGDGVHVNALYQAVAHGDYALAEMFLDHGAWLCREWREIRDLAEELGDDDIQSLLERYDVRKMHMRYLRDSEHLEENRVSRDEIYDDSVNIRLLPGQIRHGAVN
ncbi:hypothetical protein FJTKL_00462 [Diaporthe vaccinii]|uniref:Ankyrin repeat protein n=1 Tax=Diaporthe vaccinii TaxID=105482 RepID=A0ABR4E306_9PEZI